MKLKETSLRDEIVSLSRSLFDRGYSVGSSGNISALLPDGSVLMTPTNSCLGRLEARRISKLDQNGNHVSGDPPSKEAPLHLAFYKSRPGAGAVVHLHSTYATALSCLQDLDPQDCLPPLTPYVVMRVGRVRLLPYVRPGDPAMFDMICALRGTSAAVLLANHGPVVAGHDLQAAVFAAEELEETAKLAFVTGTLMRRQLTESQIVELMKAFPPPEPG
ncbi:MAG: L-fuculose-phosphate aldolase [Microvirga sp.]|jgi:ribulose-5-phosphate 4-epimerase/fuculose-1-phosphate aldolase|nr:L-fuculose-phosphate aldolase [Microvirga sp.]